MTFISGDTSAGTDNDCMLRSILGENWRELTGQDKPVVEEGGSRGYSHAAAWLGCGRQGGSCVAALVRCFAETVIAQSYGRGGGVNTKPGARFVLIP